MHRLRAHYQWPRAARLVRQRCRVSGGLVGGTPLCSRLRCAAPGHFDFSEAWSWVACLGRRSRVISLALGPKPLGVHRLEAIWWPRAARLLGSDVCPPVLLVGRLEFFETSGLHIDAIGDLSRSAMRHPWPKLPRVSCLGLEGAPLRLIVDPSFFPCGISHFARRLEVGTRFNKSPSW